MRQRDPKGDALDDELAQLARLDAAALRRLWRERRGMEAPVFATARHMRLALAWDAQARNLGGESRRLQRAWTRIEEARAAGAAPADGLRGASAPAAAHGTRLIKKWRGQTHEVLVCSDGVEWKGQRYRSLSAVARMITGANRNGPAFFGLRDGGGPGR